MSNVQTKLRRLRSEVEATREELAALPEEMEVFTDEAGKTFLRWRCAGGATITLPDNGRDKLTGDDRTKNSNEEVL